MDTQQFSQQRSQQIQQQQQNDDDDLKQKQAFPFSQVNQNHQDWQAYQYLSKVRNQAIQLKLIDKNNQKIQQQKFMEQKNKEQFIQQSQVFKQQSQQWQIEWRKQVVQNWKCIIQNIKYIQKNNKRILKSQIDLHNLPKIHQLAVSLTVGKIQKLLSKIVQDYAQNQQNSSINHYVWIYSLLAVHQSQAPYYNFQVLADLNAFVVFPHQKLIQTKIIKVLLKEYFRQNHLKY